MDEYLKTVEVNLDGTMRMSLSLAAHALLARQGGIVALTRASAATWAKDGIRCNAVAPGWVKTVIPVDGGYSISG